LQCAKIIERLQRINMLTPHLGLRIAANQLAQLIEFQD